MDDLGVPVGANDLVFVRAAVVDASGNVCPNESRTVKFHLNGGSFAGEDAAACEMGIASALVRTSPRSGRFSITASATGLKLFRK